MDDDADDWQEEVHDEHDSFDEEEEHGKDGDDDVVVGQAASLLVPYSTSYLALESCSRLGSALDDESLEIEWERVYVQLSPNNRRHKYLPIDHGVNRRNRIAVEPIVEPVLPQLCAI